MLSSKVCGMTERKRFSCSIFCVSKRRAGDCYVTLHKDTNDGAWYDFCEYQLHKIGVVVVPIFKTMSTPKEFCLKFLSPKTEYIVLCVGNKLSKPKELKGIKKFASVSFIPNRCTCQLFLDDSDLYIKHPDYFSPTYCRPEDYGTPLSYRAKKYGISVPKNKFIYDDNWGAIVLRREAWIKISNFVSWFVIWIMYRFLPLFGRCFADIILAGNWAQYGLEFIFGSCGRYNTAALVREEY